MNHRSHMNPVRPEVERPSSILLGQDIPTWSHYHGKWCFQILLVFSHWFIFKKTLSHIHHTCVYYIPTILHHALWCPTLPATNHPLLRLLSLPYFIISSYRAWYFVCFWRNIKASIILYLQIIINTHTVYGCMFCQIQSWNSKKQLWLW